VNAATEAHEAFKRADGLRRAGRIDNAIRAFDELVDRYDRYEGEGATYVQRSVAAALAFKAEAYRNTKQWDRELEVMDDLLARFATSTDLDIRRRVAFALGRKGAILRKTGRRVEARTVWLSMLDHFQAGESPEIDESLQQVRAALTRIDRPLPARVVTGALRPVLRRLTR
jgi:tetratricopeptide (TPR) repeat protein